MARRCELYYDGLRAGVLYERPCPHSPTMIALRQSSVNIQQAMIRRQSWPQLHPTCLEIYLRTFLPLQSFALRIPCSKGRATGESPYIVKVGSA